jgi:gliding motility-associated-like protein
MNHSQKKSLFLDFLHKKNILSLLCIFLFAIGSINSMVPDSSNPSVSCASKPNNLESFNACILELFLVPDDATITCDELQNIDNPVLFDGNADCCAPLTLTLVVDTIPGTCPILFSLVRTWVLSDECGSSISDQQVIKVRDLTPPVFTLVPPSITVSCHEIPSPPLNGVGIIAEDNCGGDVGYTYAQTTVPGPICPQNYLIIRTWTASDSCGNSSFAQQQILVRDFEAPVFIDPPQDITLSCGDTIPTPPLSLEVEDNCSGQLFVTFNESLSGWSYCDIITRTRTWRVEDQCGNISTHSQYITQMDQSAPIFENVPGDITVSCENLPSNQPTVSDDCDPDLEIIYTVDTLVFNCPGTYQYNRIWQVSDYCGKETITSQMVTVIDDVSPSITFTHPLLINLANGDTLKMPCTSNVIFGVDDAIITDNCDLNPQKIFIDSLIFEDDCKKLLYCEWQGIDHCGNLTSFIFYMYVGDFTGPILTNIPPNLTLECGVDIPEPVNPDIEDDCDLGPKITYIQTLQAGSCPQSYTILRTWTGRDFCGNETTATQTISVVDQTAPKITPVHPLIIGLNSGSIIQVTCDQSPVLNSSAVTAIDLCDNNPNLVLTVSTEEYDCATFQYIRQITHEWTATDDCGNTSIFIIYIRVIDTTPPTFDFIPADLTLSCELSIPSSQPTVSDNCDSPVSLTLVESINGNACERIVQRTWTATDACGNQSTATQLIYISDKTPPVLGVVPADLTIDCTEPLPPAASVSISDNCDTIPAITLSESIISGICPTNYTMIRTWTGTDICGNKSTKTQIITVIDNNSPIITTVPTDLKVQCDDIPVTHLDVVAEDLCADTVYITYSDQITQGNCKHDYLITRTFIANDGCGNTSTASHHIVVIDNTPPQFTSIPDILTIECSQADTPPYPTAIDNCDPNVTITHDSEIIAQGSCAGEYTMLVTWTVVDDCGNLNTASAEFQVVDTKPPVITPTHPIMQNVVYGDTIRISCEQLPVMNEEDVLVEDLCDPNPEVSFSEEVEFGECEKDGYLYRLTCIWTATDDCGNISSFLIYIEVIDEKGPQFILIPDDLTINLENGENIPMPFEMTADDNCDLDVEISFGEDTIPKLCGYILQRTWTAKDKCGNITVYTQLITVKDVCPCTLPEIEQLTISHPKCTNNNGQISFLMSNDSVLYLFDWSPALGVPSFDNSTRSNLPEGQYQVTITDPNGGPGCQIIEQINLILESSCVDTVYVTLNEETSHLECLDSVIDLSGTITSASICGMDSLVVESLSFNLPETCVELTFYEGFQGETEICVVHCNDANPQQCDTTYIILTRNGLLPPCDSIFENEEISGFINNCFQTYDLCLNASPEALSEYKIMLNGVEYNQTLQGCNFISIKTYALDLLPDGGKNGPFILDNWTINGNQYQFQFNDIAELILFMSQVDPAGKWEYDSFNNRITGGLDNVNYGPLVIRKAGQSTIYTIGLTETSIPQGTRIKLPEGEHFITATRLTDGCTDAMFVIVNCEDNQEEQLLAIDDSVFTKSNIPITIKILNNDIIPDGILTDFYLVDYVTNGALIYTAPTDIHYTPQKDFCGTDYFEYAICNNYGCDSAVVTIEVKCVKLIIHNGFSPNGDGINDVFTIEGIEDFPNNELTIYNRWGNLVYHAKGYDNTWGGDWQGGQLPNGTFFYLLDDGEGETFSGYLQLHR